MDSNKIIDMMLYRGMSFEEVLASDELTQEEKADVFADYCDMMVNNRLKTIKGCINEIVNLGVDETQSDYLRSAGENIKALLFNEGRMEDSFVGLYNDSVALTRYTLEAKQNLDMYGSTKGLIAKMRQNKRIKALNRQAVIAQDMVDYSKELVDVLYLIKEAGGITEKINDPLHTDFSKYHK